MSNYIYRFFITNVSTMVLIVTDKFYMYITTVENLRNINAI